MTEKKTWCEWAEIHGKKNKVSVGLRDFGSESEMMTHKQFKDTMRGQTVYYESEPGLKQRITAKQLHDWYLEATKKLNPKNYNPKAQIPYEKLNREQKLIDQFIADKIMCEMDKTYTDMEKMLEEGKHFTAEMLLSLLDSEKVK